MRSLPLYGGLGIGVVAALGFVAMPGAMLESIVWNSGIAAILPVAAPPLGVTARAVLALGFGGLFAAVAWSALYLLFGPGGLLVRPARAHGVPVIRRADAHPDAPPRRPMSAADLGQPLMEVVMPSAPDRTIPADLDLPLAAFDPAALLQVPMEPARPVAPLIVAERNEAPTVVFGPPAEPHAPSVPVSVVDPVPTGPVVTFGMPEEAAPAEPEPVVEPTPAVRPARPAAAPSSPPSIESLLRRLEQGAGRRAQITAR